MKLTKNKKIILAMFLGLIVLTPCLVLADWEVPAATEYPGVAGDFDDTVIKATNWLLGFVTMLGVLVIIWGGINYIGSAGDEEKARTAKKTITYGLLGVVVAGFAYAAVSVIVTKIL